MLLRPVNGILAMECLHYALNLPTSVVITGIDSQEILQQAFEAAETFKPMSKEEVAALQAKTGRAEEQNAKHETPKARKHEKRRRNRSFFFVFSFFRCFVFLFCLS